MKSTLAQTRRWIKAVGEMNPEKLDGVHTMLTAIEKEGALDLRMKELIAVAVSVSRQSQWCIAYHVKHALNAGANEEEVIEAAWMAVLLGGCPALMQLGFVLDTLQDFRGET